MLYQRNLIVGRNPFPKTAQYFRLISANSDLRVRFIDMSGNNTESVVKVGMQIPLPAQHKAIEIEAEEAQLVEFWWGETPVDSLSLNITGASGVKVSSVVCPAGETLLTLPSSLRQSVKLKSNSDIYIGHKDAGETGWFLSANEEFNIPLAGSIYAYKKPVDYTPQTLAVLDQSQVLSSSGINQQYWAASSTRKIFLDSDHWGGIHELNADGTAFDIIYDENYPDAGDSTQKIWCGMSRYHNVGFGLIGHDDSTNHHIVIYEFDLSASAGQYSTIAKVSIANPLDQLSAYRCYKRRNGDYVLYNPKDILFIRAGAVIAHHKPIDNWGLRPSVTNYGGFKIAEFDGLLCAFVRGMSSTYYWSYFNEQDGHWLPFTGDDEFISPNYLWYDAFLADDNVLIQMPYDTSGAVDLFVAKGSPQSMKKIVNFWDYYAEMSAVEMVGDTIFYSKYGRNLYSRGLNDDIGTLVHSVSDTDNSGFLRVLCYLPDSNRILWGESASSTTSSVTGRFTELSSGFAESVGGAKVQVMELLA